MNFGESRHVTIGKWGFCAFVAGAALAWGAQWRAEKLPPAAFMRPTTLRDPVQSKVPESFTPLSAHQRPQDLKRGESLFIRKKKHVYEITPHHEYRLNGLIVTQSETSNWMNISHARAGDVLNTKDICVVWGRNATNPYLERFKFWSGDWTCYVQTRDTEAWQSFRLDQLSNNHLLPATDGIAQAIAATRIGDQIELTGYLVDYDIDGRGSFRRSSVSRDDTGGTACEVVYVTYFKIVARANGRWWKIASAGWATSLLGALAAVAGFFVLPFIGRGSRSDSEFS